MHENYHIFTFSPVTNEAINYLSSIGDSAWKLSHFHFFSLLLRFSYEPIILISKTDIARIVKDSVVKTLKLQAALPKRNFRPEFFLVIFRISVLSICFEKNITIWFYQLRFHHRGFRENVMFRFFSEQEIYIFFLVSQIIIVFVELCKSNRPNLLG